MWRRHLTPPAFRAASPSAFDPREVGEPSASDALVLRILDAAASKRPPMGLFDPREADQLQATTASDFRTAFPATADPQFATTRDGADALAQRILDGQPAAELVDPRGYIPWPATYQPPGNMPSAKRPRGLLSLVRIPSRLRTWPVRRQAYSSSVPRNRL